MASWVLPAIPNPAGARFEVDGVDPRRQCRSVSIGRQHERCQSARQISGELAFHPPSARIPRVRAQRRDVNPNLAEPETRGAHRTGAPARTAKAPRPAIAARRVTAPINIRLLLAGEAGSTRRAGSRRGFEGQGTLCEAALLEPQLPWRPAGKRLREGHDSSVKALHDQGRIGGHRGIEGNRPERRNSGDAAARSPRGSRRPQSCPGMCRACQSRRWLAQDKYSRSARPRSRRCGRRAPWSLPRLGPKLREAPVAPTRPSDRRPRLAMARRRPRSRGS